MHKRSRDHEPAIPDIDPGELESILQRIDERSIQNRSSHEFYVPHQVEELDGPAALPGIAEMSRRLHELYLMQAPLYVVKGRDVRNRLKSLLNLPMRIIHYKQIRFNREVLDLMRLILMRLQMMSQQSGRRDSDG